MQKISIEIAYINHDGLPKIDCLTVVQPITIKDVLLSWCGSQTQLTKWSQQGIGVFNQTVSDAYQLQDNDRIELYHPLSISPMNRRRLLAKKR